jgi:hypothetical protein
MACSFRQVDTLYVEGAALEQLSVHDQIRQAVEQGQANRTQRDFFAITGHRIVPDGGTILAFRVFSRPTIPLVDQAGFQKLTIFIPFALTTEPVEITLSKRRDVIAFWSNANSNFPRRSGCYGYAADGSIHLVKRSPTEIVADLSLTFDLVSAGGWRGECSRLTFKKELVLEQKAVQYLTPWEGRPSSEPYEESMR